MVFAALQDVDIRKEIHCDVLTISPLFMEARKFRSETQLSNEFVRSSETGKFWRKETDGLTGANNRVTATSSSPFPEEVRTGIMHCEPGDTLAQRQSKLTKVLFLCCHSGLVWIDLLRSFVPSDLPLEYAANTFPAYGTSWLLLYFFSNFSVEKMGTMQGRAQNHLALEWKFWNIFACSSMANRTQCTRCYFLEPPACPQEMCTLFLYMCACFFFVLFCFVGFFFFDTRSFDVAFTVTQVNLQTFSVSFLFFRDGQRGASGLLILQFSVLHRPDLSGGGDYPIDLPWKRSTRAIAGKKFPSEENPRVMFISSRVPAADVRCCLSHQNQLVEINLGRFWQWLYEVNQSDHLSRSWLMRSVLVWSPWFTSLKAQRWNLFCAAWTSVFKEGTPSKMSQGTGCCVVLCPLHTLLCMSANFTHLNSLRAWKCWEGDGIFVESGDKNRQVLAFLHFDLFFLWFLET